MTGSPSAALGGPDNPFSIARVTAAGAVALTSASKQHQSIDCDGSHRDVTLPAVGISAGLAFYITNRTAATYNLVVKNSGGTTLVTVPPKAAVYCHCDGTGWSIILGAAVTSQT